MLALGEQRDAVRVLDRRAEQLDPNLPLAHSHLGWVLMFEAQHEAAIAEFKLSLSLNPNFNDPSFGLGLVVAGESARAVEMLQRTCALIRFRIPVAWNRWATLCTCSSAMPKSAAAARMRIGLAFVTVIGRWIGSSGQRTASRSRIG